MKIAVLDSQTVLSPRRDGLLAGRLCEALAEHGHSAALIRIPFSERSPQTVVDQMLAVRLLHLHNVDRVVGLGFPAYLIPHGEKVVWMLREFREAYDRWGTAGQGLPNTPLGRSVRASVLAADQEYLGEAQRIYVRSSGAGRRLTDYTGLQSQVLHPPLRDPGAFRCDSYGDYVLALGPVGADSCGRAAVEAIALAQSAARLVIAGSPERRDDVAALRDLAERLGVADRVELIAHDIAEAERVRLLAACRAVLCFGDPDGRLTQEACQSHKATLAFAPECALAALIDDGVTGAIVSSIAGLGLAIDALSDDAATAERYGDAAFDRLARSEISWSTVVAELTK